MNDVKGKPGPSYSSIKEDLAMLSKRLLPPPANSTEYVAKIKQLREVFPREQKTIITLLAFSGRYPDLMRDIQQDIASHYEEGRHLSARGSSPQTLGKVFGNYFSKCKQDGRYRETYLAEELAMLEHDAQRLITTHIELSDIRPLFDFVRTFSFVGDIGQDADH